MSIRHKGFPIALCLGIEHINNSSPQLHPLAPGAWAPWPLKQMYSGVSRYRRNLSTHCAYLPHPKVKGMSALQQLTTGTLSLTWYILFIMHKLNIWNADLMSRFLQIQCPLFPMDRYLFSKTPNYNDPENSKDQAWASHPSQQHFCQPRDFFLYK